MLICLFINKIVRTFAKYFKNNKYFLKFKHIYI